MEPSRDQVAGGLHFLQLAAAATAEEEGKPTEADHATGEHGLQQAAASIHTAFREVQLLSHLLELTAQPKPSAGTTAFQVRFRPKASNTRTWPCKQPRRSAPRYPL